MSDQYWLGEAQLERIKPLLPAIPWPTACRRPSRDQWDRSRHSQCLEMEGYGEGPKPQRLMIDATHLKAPRTAASLAEKGGTPRRTGLVVRTIGLVRATARITLANLAYNMRRLVWTVGRPASA